MPAALDPGPTNGYGMTGETGDWIRCTIGDEVSASVVDSMTDGDCTGTMTALPVYECTPIPLSGFVADTLVAPE